MVQSLLLGHIIKMIILYMALKGQMDKNATKEGNWNYLEMVGCCH